jgi:hypothetical protein
MGDLRFRAHEFNNTYSQFAKSLNRLAAFRILDRVLLQACQSPGLQIFTSIELQM